MSNDIVDLTKTRWTNTFCQFVIACRDQEKVGVHADERRNLATCALVMFAVDIGLLPPPRLLNGDVNMPFESP